MNNVVTKKTKLKILIVEDETVLLDKYRTYLATLFDDIHIADSYEKATKLIKGNNFSVALLDYNLPDGTGLELTKELKEKNPNILITLITAYSKERLAIESLNLGVHKYLEKPVDKKDLLSLMNEVKRDAYSKIQEAEIISHFNISAKAKEKLEEEYFLTEREIEVASLILIHGKNKIVGDLLEISQGTVRNHLSNIYQKLHLASKDELKEIINKLNQR